MPSLTESARVSKVVIQWSIIGLVGLMVGRMVIGGLISWYKKAHPAIPAPTMGFGTLPDIVFPTNPAATQYSYALQTVTGKLPVLPTQADVLLESVSRPNLLAMERSTDDAASLGFQSQPEKVSDLVYRWRLSTPLTSTLTMKIYDGRFLWDTSWATNPTFLTEKSLPSQTQAIKDAQSYVKRLVTPAEDLGEDAAVVTYLKASAGEYVPADSLSDADFVEVDLFRNKYKDTYAFVTPRADQGVVRVILSGNSKLGKVTRMEYNYFAVDYTTLETYPLKPVQQAWNELQAGSGYVAQLNEGVSQIIVRKVEMGYFDSFEPQKYIQPVYVFTGDNNFVGYVPAVKPTTTK